MKYLIEKGAYVNANITIHVLFFDRWLYDSTPVLHLAVINQHLEMVKYLLDKCADVNAKDRYKKTALHWASEIGHLEIVQCLIKKRADVNAYNTQGRTALHLASIVGHFKIVQCLLSNGANVNSKVIFFLGIRTSWSPPFLEIELDSQNWKEFKRTALHFASKKGHLEIVKTLIDNGADVNAKDNMGKRALHWASDAGCLQIVQYLIAKGADLNARDNLKRKALDLASNQSFFKTLSLKHFANADAKKRYLASRKEVAKFLTSISK